MQAFALRLCGDVVLCSRDGAPVEPPLGSKTLALLAFLALEPGSHRREQGTALLWGEYPEEKAKASLRQALTHLRDALGEALRVDRNAIELGEGLSCDVVDFIRLASHDAAAAIAIDIPIFSLVWSSATARRSRSGPIKSESSSWAATPPCSRPSPAKRWLDWPGAMRRGWRNSG